MLSKKAQNLKTSPTLFLVAKSKELASKGHDVISLTVGEPDWATYKVASEAGIEAIQKGMTKYTAANGTLELRNEVAKKINFEIGVEYKANQITIGPGAKFVIFQALQMLCDPGSEVIIHSPYWVSYPTMVELSDGKPVIVTCTEKENFKISPEQLEKAITKNTKAFIFCSPSNPTGFVYSEKELQALAQVLKKHPHIFILSDDMYNRLMFNGAKAAPHILQVAPELKDRTVVFNGGSKAYAMTGWRIGWAAGPEKLIAAMGDYQSQSTGAPSSIAQYAALRALQNCEADIAETNKMLINRYQQAVEAFTKIPQIKVFRPDGAFYLWIDIKAFLNKKYKDREIRTSSDFADILLNEYFVSTVPGLEFGNDGYLRLSFAIQEKRMAEAITRIKTFTDCIQG